MTLTRKQLEAGARALLRDVVPTHGRHWWRDLDGEREVVTVHYERDGTPREWDYGDGCDGGTVTPDGRWIAPVLTPDEADALRARVAVADGELDEARADAERAARDENACAERLREALAGRDEARAEVDRLRDLLRAFVHDDDPCQLDHHGGCQAHGYLSLNGAECPHAEAKRLLAADKERA